MGQQVIIGGEVFHADLAFKYFDRESGGLLQQALVSPHGLLLDLHVALHPDNLPLLLLDCLFQLLTLGQLVFVR